MYKERERDNFRKIYVLHLFDMYILYSLHSADSHARPSPPIPSSFILCLLCKSGSKKNKRINNMKTKEFYVYMFFCRVKH